VTQIFHKGQPSHGDDRGSVAALLAATFYQGNYARNHKLSVFLQTDGIPMGTNCAPLLADLLLYSYEEDFIQGLLKKNEKKLAQSFNVTFRSTTRAC
jgi:hypothetical protein